MDYQRMPEERPFPFTPHTTYHRPCTISPLLCHMHLDTFAKMSMKTGQNLNALGYAMMPQLLIDDRSLLAAKKFSSMYQ